jgi:hypothetical protein
MKVSLTTNDFEKQILNIAQYSVGFLDGVQKGKKIFLDNMGKGVVYTLGRYIDVEAKANSAALHHVYEWYQTGSPSSRLFDIDYTVSNVGLSLNSTFKQSRTLAEDATVPFYNKARIMENGIPVTIKPKRVALRFTAGGEEIFTRKPVTVRDPGGQAVQGSFERTFDEFMRNYFTQGFLRASGLFDYIENPTIYKKNIAAGAKGGKSVGVTTGFKWITNAKVEVE